MLMPPPPPRGDEPTMATLAQMMQQVMSTMATGNDIAGVQNNIASLEDKVVGLVKAVATTVNEVDHKIHSVEQRMDDIDNWKENHHTELRKMKEEAIAAAKVGAESAAAAATTRAASSSTTSPQMGRRTSTGSSARSTASRTTDWRPRVVHVRGLAPYGSTGKKLTRGRAVEEQQKITSFRDHFAEETRWLQPFAQSHCWSFEVVHAEPWTAKNWADKVNMKINSMNDKMSGCEVRAAVETSPQRREALKSFFESRDDIQSLNSDGTRAPRSEKASTIGTRAPGARTSQRP